MTSLELPSKSPTSPSGHNNNEISSEVNPLSVTTYNLSEASDLDLDSKLSLSREVSPVHETEVKARFPAINDVTVHVIENCCRLSPLSEQGSYEVADLGHGNSSSS